MRGDDEAVRALLHQDFREFGASGTVWDRQSIVQATGGGAAERVAADDLRPVQLGQDAVLLTYTARRARGASLRTSVWVRDVRGVVTDPIWKPVSPFGRSPCTRR